jgi:hypothetical protein
MMVPAGYKRSLNLSLDFVNKKQKLHGYQTLNLLNENGDPSLLSTVLYSHIARQYIPAPKANLVKVVINGESWGIYTSAQQFNKKFLAENFKTEKGARWKVRGSPGGGGGLDYLGEDVEAYKRRYTLKTADNDNDWKALIELCRTLNKTPLDQLEKALEPILNIDGVLWFLALDNVLMNEDGYWIRGSDYSLYRHPKGKFHIIPHDMNEAFKPGMGPPGMGPGMGFGKGPKDGAGFGKGPKEGGPGNPFALDPLIGLNDSRKPLRSRLLAVPALKERYLQHVRTIAQDWLDWQKLGPIVAQYRKLIEKEVEIDTRKLSTLAAFQRSTADALPKEAAGPGRGMGLSLRAFAEQRRAYLLNYAEVKKAAGS